MNVYKWFNHHSAKVPRTKWVICTSSQKVTKHRRLIEIQKVWLTSANSLIRSMFDPSMASFGVYNRHGSLIGGIPTPLKNISQIGSSSQLLGKIKAMFQTTKRFLCFLAEQTIDVPMLALHFLRGIWIPLQNDPSTTSRSIEILIFKSVLKHWLNLLKSDYINLGSKNVPSGNLT